MTHLLLEISLASYNSSYEVRMAVQVLCGTLTHYVYSHLCRPAVHSSCFGANQQAAELTQVPSGHCSYNVELAAKVLGHTVTHYIDAHLCRPAAPTAICCAVQQ